MVRCRRPTSRSQTSRPRAATGSCHCSTRRRSSPPAISSRTRPRRPASVASAAPRREAGQLTCFCARSRVSRRGRRLPLLRPRSRGRPRPRRRWLRGDRRHRAAGGDAPARPTRAARPELPRGGGVPAGGGEADARLRRRYGAGGRARRLSRRRQRRRRRGADGLPPALARARRPPWRDGRMSLIVRLEEELKQAMVEREAERRDTLRLILSSLRSAEKELQRPLHDDEELQVLQRERKRRTEAAEAFRAGGRDEQAEGEERELAVLEEFMPEPLDEEELEEIVDDAIAEVGATSMRDIGRVMADVMPQVAGRADGSAVSQLVREKLA